MTIDGESPYRERPPMLECPRCGEVLAEVTTGVSMCARCGGLWLAQRTVTAAFQDPTWPHGVGMWWRRDLPCPQCAFEGSSEMMSTVSVGDLLLDRCVDHGLWLDRGELARLVGGSPLKELEWLKQVLSSDRRPTPAAVTDEDVARQRAELEAYRADVAARQKREEERAAHEQAAELARMKADDETRRQRRMAELRGIRDHARAEIEQLLADLRMYRETIATDEEKLAAARKRFRDADQELEALTHS
jgi:Zn-finger nucleic acid-binding protein